MKGQLLVLILLVQIFHLWATPFFNQLRHKRENFCGPDLRRAVRLVCNGVYYDPGDKRKVTDFVDFEALKDYDDTEDVLLEYPFLPKSLASRLIPSKSRRGGIVQECCDKPCSYDELKAYCQS